MLRRQEVEAQLLSETARVTNLKAEMTRERERIARTSSYDCRSSGPARELCNLPWAMHNYWLHYRHTMDDALLKR